MSVFEKALTLDVLGVTAVLPEDRRYNTRDRLVRDISIQSLDPSQPQLVGTVIDLSRDGLYFTVSSRFEVGTPLRLRFSSCRSECLCEVVRVESLPQGRFGVGARILSW